MLAPSEPRPAPGSFSSSPSLSLSIISSTSESGSFFFYSADYRFVLKTCTKREARAPADAPGRTGGAERNHCPDSLALGKKRGTAAAAPPPTPLRRRARRRLF